jgi:hypothetical protein
MILRRSTLIFTCLAAGTLGPLALASQNSAAPAEAPAPHPHYNVVDARGTAVATIHTSPGPDGAAASIETFEGAVQPFLAKNCYLCHNSKLKTAEVDFSQFKTDALAEQGTETWEKALEKLRRGEMPPKGMPRPKQADIDVAMRWMEEAIARADANAKPDPGRVTAHRLNRVEYNNTVRDLLGIDIHPADDFPQDDSGYGFDNIGDVLSLSPVLMERYMTAADRLVHTALYGPEKLKPIVVRHQPVKREYPLLMTAPADYDRSGLSMPNALHATNRFPVDADYTIRVSLSGERPGGSEPLHVGIWLDGKQVQTVTFDEPPPGPLTTQNFGHNIDLSGIQQEVRLHVPAGDHWLAASILNIYEGLPPSYGGPNPTTRPLPPPPDQAKLLARFMKFAKLPPDATPEQIAKARALAETRIKALTPAANRVYVHYVEVVGPYNEKMGPELASRKLIFVCGNGNQHSANCPNLILSHFARRAFRRPIDKNDLQPYLELYAQARKAGSSFDDAIGVSLQAILVSPDFLFRIETPGTAPQDAAILRKVSYGDSQAVGAQPVSEYALASRLSYFLWSTMPDDELMRCADRHTLRRPEVLRAQVERMLKDPRSHALADNFAGQWLELRKLESDNPDHERFPQWDDYLRMSMQQETELFFEDVVHHDKSILDFLDSKTTFLNEKLAEFYGIPGVKGAEFQKVDLTGTHRAGILTQASVLTVSSYATRTSPVLRGKWVLENFLNATIPPPPPNVPRFDEAKIGLDATMRQQLEEHRKNPMCASCHNKMDPIGFSFENYNAIGQWRDKDGIHPVDATGQLPTGQTFNGALQLEEIYRKQPEAFAECVTVKLMTYALGRGIERYDRPTIKEIVKRIAADDYRFSDLVIEIVNSLPFEMRRGGDRT